MYAPYKFQEENNLNFIFLGFSSLNVEGICQSVYYVYYAYIL